MRVICIGAMHLLKGYDLLLEATAVAVEPWQLVIVGDGPERARLEAKTAALPPGRFVTFAGWQVDPTNAVLGADVLCAPSRYESFSYVIIEAMALARPVVATAVDGAPEAVSDGVTGRLVPAEDPPSLAAALDELARDPKGRIGMGREGRARVAAEFEVTQMVRRTLQLYTQVRERPHAPLAKLRTYASDLSPRRATGDSDQPRNHTEGSVSCARKVSGQGAFVHATRFNPRFARQIPQPRNVSGL
jgi:glycosyltransferase involved in cell wall biosynthesis